MSRVKKEEARDLTGRCIEVVVGSSPTISTFSVHENLVCGSSIFFEKAIRGNWKESEERVVRLENESPDVFFVYLQWLYFRTLPVRIDEPERAGNAEYLQLAKAYVLGDMLLDIGFKDDVIDAMIEKTKSKTSDGHAWFPVGLVIQVIYNNTLETSKARGLLVDLYSLHGRGKWLEDWGDQETFPRAFLFDLAVALLDTRPEPQEATDPINRCKYHEHMPDASVCSGHAPSSQRDICEGGETDSDESIVF